MQNGAITIDPSGMLEGGAELFVRGALIINDPLSTPQNTAMPENTTCAGNQTLIDISAGVRVKGEADLNVFLTTSDTPVITGQLASIHCQVAHFAVLCTPVIAPACQFHIFGGYAAHVCLSVHACAAVAEVCNFCVAVSLLPPLPTRALPAAC